MRSFLQRYAFFSPIARKGPKNSLPPAQQPLSAAAAESWKNVDFSPKTGWKSVISAPKRGWKNVILGTFLLEKQIFTRFAQKGGRGGGCSSAFFARFFDAEQRQEVGGVGAETSRCRVGATAVVFENDRSGF